MIKVREQEMLMQAELYKGQEKQESTIAKRKRKYLRKWLQLSTSALIVTIKIGQITSHNLSNLAALVAVRCSVY